MASKGLCCAAQAAGDLGKPLLVTIHKKDGTNTQRCGVCEVVPSCRNPQTAVFAFRFLKSAVCGLLGSGTCKPSAAGIAQYSQQRTLEAAGTEPTRYSYSYPALGGPPVLTGGAVPGYRPGAYRVALPSP